MAHAIKVHLADIVATVIQPVQAGETVTWSQPDGQLGQLTAAEQLPCYHKLALQPIAKGEQVIKYGQVIGIATQDIPQGGWVHTHNIDSPSKVEGGTAQ